MDKTKFNTNYDLMFIRKLKEDGLLVHSNKDQDFSMMYINELHQHFQKMKRDLENNTQPAKLGPRHILNPGLLEMERATKIEKFNKEKFVSNLKQKIDKLGVPPTLPA